jgi:hypothetical protein
MQTRFKPEYFTCLSFMKGKNKVLQDNLPLICSRNPKILFLSPIFVSLRLQTNAHFPATEEHTETRTWIL